MLNNSIKKIFLFSFIIMQQLQSMDRENHQENPLVNRVFNQNNNQEGPNQTVTHRIDPESLVQIERMQSRVNKRRIIDSCLLFTGSFIISGTLLTTLTTLVWNAVMS